VLTTAANLEDLLHSSTISHDLRQIQFLERRKVRQSVRETERDTERQRELSPAHLGETLVLLDPMTKGQHVTITPGIDLRVGEEEGRSRETSSQRCGPTSFLTTARL
jgi:hypothetical protein